MTSPHILLIDNFDSFSFNLVDAFAVLGAEVEVFRNSVSAEQALAHAAERRSRAIVISPGPGSPEQAGCCIELIQQAAGHFPVLGVCLGHQAIVNAFGGKVGSAGAIVHGKKSRVSHDGHDLFAFVPSPFEVGRYHSLIAHGLPDALACIAQCDEIVMALAHKTHPIYGVQFHPESILTTWGQQILSNFLSISAGLAPPGVARCIH